MNGILSDEFANKDNQISKKKRKATSYMLGGNPGIGIPGIIPIPAGG